MLSALFPHTTVERSPYPPDVSGRAPERRSHHRALIGTAAWLVVDQDRVSAECLNVSMGGAALLTNAHLAVGTPVHLELSLGLDRGTISIPCEVVRSSATQAGLRFLELDRGSLEALLRLV